MNVAFDTLEPRFAAMRGHLARQQGARRMPCRAELDPHAFRDLLAFVNLIDAVLENDAVRFRFRLVGTAQSAAAQVDHAGRFVDDVVDPASRPRVMEDLTRVVATCMPHYGRYGMPFPQRGFIDSERVCYPLSTDDRMVDCILALHHYPDLGPSAAPGLQAWHLEAWRQALSGTGAEWSIRTGPPGVVLPNIPAPTGGGDRPACHDLQSARRAPQSRSEIAGLR